MSSKYIKADDYNYFFKSEPRELSVHDSLAFVDNFGHSVEGQAGMVLRTLAEEVRRLNRVIHAAKVSGTEDSVGKHLSGGFSNSTDW